MLTCEVSPTPLYRPLDNTTREIRVLDVQPSLDAARPVHGSLRTIVLPKARPPRAEQLSSHRTEELAQAYETISYAWGDARRRCVILIDGVALDVPASAESAVQRMRDRHSMRTLWIDSICINQRDINERSHQVEIMGDVYAHSTCNLIWLGESDESTASAVQSFNAVYDEILHATDNLRTWAKTLEGFYAGDRANVHTAYDLPAMVRFYSRPWFSRLWVSLV